MNLPENCPRCGGKNSQVTIHQDGEIVCTDCGFVYIEKYIDETPEERKFTQNFTSYGGSNKDLSRYDIPDSAYSGGFVSGVNLIGCKRGIKLNNKWKKFENNFCNEEDKKAFQRSKDLKRIFYELNKISSSFEIPKVITESAKEQAIKLYDFGKILLRNNSGWQLILGLLINFSLKNITQCCLSIEDISKYFKCDLEFIKKQAGKIYKFLENSKTISLIEKEFISNTDIKINSKKNINSGPNSQEDNKKKERDNYLAQLNKETTLLIKKTRINTLSGISNSFGIAKIFIEKGIFNIEAIPPISLAGGSLIFCARLYCIEFIIKTKSKEKYDETYSTKNEEEIQKLIAYVAKRCGTGIKKEKIKNIYEIFIKYQSILKDNLKYAKYLINLRDKENSETTELSEK